VSYPTCDIEGDFHRLIPSRFPPVALYARLGSPEIQDAAQAVEEITNPRLQAMELLAQEGPEAVKTSGAQNWNLAPFAYPNPEGTTFLSSKYKVLELVEGLMPALVVAVERREAFLSGSDEPPIDIDMRALVHPVKGRFADLRNVPFETVEADRWKVGAELYETEAQGIVFHRPDLPGIRAVAVFDRTALGRAVQSDHFKFVWDGEAVQKVGNFSTDQAMDRKTLFSALINRAAA
jgi:hypothetical protein